MSSQITRRCVLPAPAKAAEAAPAEDTTAATAPAGEELQQQAAQLKDDLTAAQEAIERDKWAALEEQQKHAAQLRAELAETEARLAQHQDAIAAREQAAKDEKKRVAVIAQIEKLAEQEQTRMAALPQTISSLEDMVKDLEETAENIIGAALRHEKSKLDFRNCFAQMPGETKEMQQALREANVNLTALHKNILEGFVEKEMGYRPPNFWEMDAAVSPLAFKLLQALLSDSKVQERLRNKLGYGVNKWLPEGPKPKGHFIDQDPRQMRF